MSGSLHRIITRHLRDAGSELVRNGKHAMWKHPIRGNGVAVSKNIRDKNLARSLLRGVGLNDVRL